jgi:hypothetical protein
MQTNRAFLTVLVMSTITAAAWGQGAAFSATTIDQNHQGDCKAIADIDGDGRGDAIVGGSPLYWYESGANFARRTIRTQPVHEEFTTDMQAADVDGDGDPDLIIGDGGGSSNILWFVNPRINPPSGLGSDPRVAANWTYRTIGTHGDTVHDLEVADLDNDGRLDVVTSGHGFTKIWKQNSPTSWTSRDLSSMAGSGVFIGDIDRDGFRDLATPFGWIRNPQSITTGTWTFFPINQTTSGDECLLADLNGDQRLDLMTCDAHSRGPMVWFQAPATPTSAAWTKRTIDSNMGAHHPETADFNRDGLPDILMGLELQDLSVYMNLGGSPPTFDKVQLADRYAHNARAGDLNGDQFPDVLGCDYITNPPVRVFINQTPPPPACYANCDGSAAVPLLTPNDFQCFINRFADNDSWANCDQSTASPLLTPNDFLCFLNGYAAGCN